MKPPHFLFLKSTHILPKIIYISLFYYSITTFTLYVIRQFWTSTLIADQILALASINALFTIMYLRVLNKKKSNPEYYYIYILTVLSCFLSYLLVTTQIIVNTDRSRSFFIFEWVKCAPPDASVNDIRKQIELKYGSPEVNAFDLRLKEQISRNLISTNNNKLVLTKSGNFVYETANIAAKVFKLDGWSRNYIWESSCNSK